MNTRPCHCDLIPSPSQPFAAGYCYLCWKWHSDERYRRLWSGQGPIVGPRAAKRPLPCVHLGRALERTGGVCRRNELHICERQHHEPGESGVRQNGLCETCLTYQADAEATDDSIATAAIVVNERHKQQITRAYRRRVKPQVPLRLGVFYHVAAMGNWQAVINEQLHHLGKVGLRTVTAGLLGSASDAQALFQTAQRHSVTLSIGYRSDHLNEYEGATLRLIRPWTLQNPHAAALYLHTKGVSNPSCLVRQRWRRLMMRHVVNDWQANLVKLGVADAVGVAYHDSGNFPHFSGNFWMARADWINYLPDIDSYRQRFNQNIFEPRVFAEMWVGSEPWFNPECLVARNQCLWYPDVIHRYPIDVPGITYAE